MVRSLTSGDDSKSVLDISIRAFPWPREMGFPSLFYSLCDVRAHQTLPGSPHNHKREKQAPRDVEMACSGSILQRRSVTLPSWRVSILIEQDHISRNPSKIGFHQGVQKFPSIDWLHGITEARIAWAEGHLHVVEPIGHGIDSIDHESHFGILNVMCSQSQRTCWETNQGLTSKFYSTIAISMDSE